MRAPCRRPEKGYAIHLVITYPEWLAATALLGSQVHGRREPPSAV
jgi:hypothetical protein